MLDKWTTLKKLIWFYTLRQQSSPEPGHLPSGYREVQGFSLNDNCYWEIDEVTLNGWDSVELEFEVSAACNVFGCYTDSSAQNNYSLYASNSSGAKYLRYNGGTYNSSFVGNINTVFHVQITPTGSSGMPVDSSWLPSGFTGTASLCIGTSSVSASSAKLKGKLYGDFVVWANTDTEEEAQIRTYKFIGVPCERESDGTLGYYDLVSKTFYEPAVGAPISLGYKDDEQLPTIDDQYMV